jgi:uncharacterized protein (TIGR03437 family)
MRIGALLLIPALAYAQQAPDLGHRSAPGAPAITSVLNEASLNTALAPGSAADVFGSNLPASGSAGAMVGNQAAQVVVAGATEWIIVVPNNAALGPSSVQIGGSPAFPITLSQYAPALFSADGTGEGIALAVRALNPGTTVTASAPAYPGDALYIFATGLGAAGNNGQPAAMPTVTLAGTAAAVTAVIPVGREPGIDQVNIQIPDNTPAGNLALVLSIGGASSQSGITLPLGAYTFTVITAAVNGASFLLDTGANAWGTIQGVNLSSTTDTWTNYIVNGALPTKIDGVSLSIGGQPAYLEYVSPYQLNFIAPDVPPGPVQVTVTNSTGTSFPFIANFAQYSPAFFTWPGNQVVATRTDYSYAVAPGTFPGATAVAAKPGDVLILWGTGLGPTTPAAPAGVEVPSTPTYNTSSPVAVTIDNVPATVYGAALAPGFASLYQVAIQVPTALPNGTWPIVASVGGVQSPSTVVLNVQQ